MHNWKTISILTGTTEGVDLMWDKILLSNDGYKYIGKQQFNYDNIGCLGTIMRHCQKMEPSFSTLSELICALVKNQMNGEAHMVFSKVRLLPNGIHLYLGLLIGKTLA